jgi:ketosteroid isomerase-like protein
VVDPEPDATTYRRLAVRRAFAIATRRSRMSAEVQDLAVRYGAAWAAHDLDAILALHTEDTVFHLHGDAEPAVGPAAVREAFASALEQWPDLRFERKRVYIGSGHFVSEYEMTATEDGREVVCDGVDVFSVRDGMVARKDTYLDWAAVQRQIGESAATPT